MPTKRLIEARAAEKKRAEERAKAPPADHPGVSPTLADFALQALADAISFKIKMDMEKQ